MKALTLLVALALVGCAERGAPRAAPDQPTGTIVDPSEPIPSPSPRIVPPREGLVNLHPQPWDDAKPLDDRTLLVTFYGGVEACYGVDRVEVEESDDAVTITLFTGTVPGDQVCIELAEFQGVEVTLDEALGDREIVDGAA